MVAAASLDGHGPLLYPGYIVVGGVHLGKGGVGGCCHILLLHYNLLRWMAVMAARVVPANTEQQHAQENETHHSHRDEENKAKFTTFAVISSVPKGTFTRVLESSGSIFVVITYTSILTWVNIARVLQSFTVVSDISIKAVTGNISIVDIAFAAILTGLAATATILALVTTVSGTTVTSIGGGTSSCTLTVVLTRI